MTTKTDKSSDFANYLQQLADIVFEVQVDASEDSIASDLGGIGSFTDQANGQLDLDLSGLGEVEAVREESVTVDTGTATISSSIDSAGDLTVSLDSNQDLTSQDVNFTVRIAVKRRL